MISLIPNLTVADEMGISFLENRITAPLALIFLFISIVLILYKVKEDHEQVELLEIDPWSEIKDNCFSYVCID